MRYTTCRPERCLLLTGLMIIIIMLFYQSSNFIKLVSHITQLGIIEPKDNLACGIYPVKHQQKDCSEKRHVVYIKVPKTGSTTIASILIRFGLERNLTFAESSKDSNVDFGNRPLLPDMILPIAEGKQYDLLVRHSTYNHTTVKKVFPNDTVIIASLRDPFSQFLSMFHYFDRLENFMSNLSDPGRIEMFIKRSYSAFKDTASQGKPKLNFNLQSMRLAVPITNYHDADFIRHYIAQDLDRNLDLVLLQDYFDESLVLMKRYLCWNLSDILYLSHNVQKYYVGQEYVYTDDIVRRHRQLATSDYMIYDHFYSKFWITVRQAGLDFFDEVRAFKDMKLRLFSFCYKNPLPNQKLLVPSTAWSAAFEVSGKRCRDMDRNNRHTTLSSGGPMEGLQSHQSPHQPHQAKPPSAPQHLGNKEKTIE